MIYFTGLVSLGCSNRIQLAQELGSGNFGTVYQASFTSALNESELVLLV